MPVDPTMPIGVGELGGAGGPEWDVGGLDAPGAPTGESFGSVLTAQLGELEHLQGEAAEASRALATGQASDPTSVVMALERARLAMQLASQIRTKSVEAFQDVFRTQV